MTQLSYTNAHDISSRQPVGNKNELSAPGRIQELIAKCFMQECDEKERNELDLWINKTENNKTFYDDTVSVLNDARNALTVLNFDKETAFDKISVRIEENRIFRRDKAKKVKRFSILMRVAVSVILLLSVGVAYFTWKTHTTDKISVTTASSEIRQITLPDGSDIVINGGSSITYPERFDKANRTISLTGEAFFTVRPDKEHPFIIKTGMFDVKVLGTSFNVKAYGNSTDAAVTVETGTVNVTSGSSSVVITKGESVIFDKRNKSLSKSKNRDINYKAWKTKQIRFVNTPLTKAVSTLKNVYRVEIEADSNILDNKTINADFDKQSIDFILNTICETYHLSYAKNGDKYVITGKK